MFRSGGRFADLMCPDHGCTRPHCQFWHDPNPQPYNGATSSLSLEILGSHSPEYTPNIPGSSYGFGNVSSISPTGAFSGYSGFVSRDPSAITAMYAPDEPTVSFYQGHSVFNGSTASTTTSSSSYAGCMSYGSHGSAPYGPSSNGTHGSAPYGPSSTGSHVSAPYGPSSASPQEYYTHTPVTLTSPAAPQYIPTPKALTPSGRAEAEARERKQREQEENKERQRQIDEEKRRTSTASISARMKQEAAILPAVVKREIVEEEDEVMIVHEKKAKKPRMEAPVSPPAESNPSSSTTANAIAQRIKALPLPKLPPPKPKTSVVSDIFASAASLSADPKMKVEKIFEYAGKVAEIDAEIERLIKEREKCKDVAVKIAAASDETELVMIKKEAYNRSPPPADPGCTNTNQLHEPPTTKPCEVAKSKKHKSRDKESEHVQPEPLYDPGVVEKHEKRSKHSKTHVSKASTTQGYVPTPIADLKKKRDAEKEKEKLRRSSSENDRSKSSVGVCNKRKSPADVIDLFESSDEETAIVVKKPKEKVKTDERKAKEKDRNVPSSSKDKTPRLGTTSMSDIFDSGIDDDRSSAAASPPPSLSNGVQRGKSLSSEQLAAARDRIARPGAVATVRHTSVRKKTLQEQLAERNKRIETDRAKVAAATSKTQKKPLTQEQIYGERNGRGEGRRATVFSTASTSKQQATVRPSLQDPACPKVPLIIRQQFLTKIFNECLCIFEPLDAKAQAEQEEKAVLDRVKNRKSYAVAVINTLKKLRDLAGSGKSGQTPKMNAVSHADMLDSHPARHLVSTLVRPAKAVKTGRLLHQAFVEHFLLNPEQLAMNSYPRWDGVGKVTIAESHYDKAKAKKTFAENGDFTRMCVRCATEFDLDVKGKVVAAECIYHSMSLSTQVRKYPEGKWHCCGYDRTYPGCCVANAHVFDTLWIRDLYQFVPTPDPIERDDWRSYAIYALDCEMVYSVDGPALARLTMVNMEGDTVLDELVRPPSTIIDMNTKFSGITEDIMKNCTMTLEQVQDRMFELVNSESILIGHSLDSDLKALRIVHERVIDTSVLYPHPQGHPKKKGLKGLALDELELIIQESDSGHDSKEDALACLRLVKKKAQKMNLM